jgi:hypothetical protein
MKRISLTTLLSLAVLFASVAAAAASPLLHTKVTPHGVAYPLISPRPFPDPGKDPYRYNFNVRRMLKSVVSYDYADTLIETVNWHRLYGGYGVLGHGEEVFTRKAELYRKSHQGR